MNLNVMNVNGTAMSNMSGNGNVGQDPSFNPMMHSQMSHQSQPPLNTGPRKNPQTAQAAQGSPNLGPGQKPMGPGIPGGMPGVMPNSNMAGNMPNTSMSNPNMGQSFSSPSMSYPPNQQNQQNPHNHQNLQNAQNRQNGQNPQMMAVPMNQYMAQQQALQPQSRPGMPRAVSVQQINTAGPNSTRTPAQRNAANPLHSPNSAPLPGSGSGSNSNTQTPQIASQPVPNGVPPTYQDDSGHESTNGKIPQNVQSAQNAQMNAQMNRIRANGPEQGPVAMGPAMIKPTPEQFQKELNIKIYKRNLGNAAVLKVLDIIEQIKTETKVRLSAVEYWQSLVQTFFTPSSTLRLSLAASEFQTNEESPEFAMTKSFNRPFELTPITAPRFFSAIFKSDSVNKFDISLPGIKYQVMNNGAIFVISKLHVTYVFNDGSMSSVDGGCKLLMNKDFRIDSIDSRFMNYKSSLNVLNVDKILDSITLKNNMDDFKHDFLQEIKQKVSSYKLAPTSGVDPDSMRIMQVSDVMANLRSLMGFTMVNNVSSPLKGLELFINANNNHQSQIIHQAQAQQQAMHAQIQQQMQAQEKSKSQEDGKSTGGQTPVPTPGMESKSNPKNRGSAQNSPHPGEEEKAKKRKLSTTGRSPMVETGKRRK